MPSKLELSITKDSKNNDIALFKLSTSNLSPPKMTELDIKLEILPGEIKNEDFNKIYNFLMLHNNISR